MVTTGAAMVLSFPVQPLGSWNRAESFRCGTGMWVLPMWICARRGGLPNLRAGAPLTGEEPEIQQKFALRLPLPIYRLTERNK
jgi:hypothetical protein